MTFGMNYIMKEIENENFRIVSIICSTIIFGYILNSILNYFQYLVNVKMSQKIGLKMRNNLLKKINLLPIDFFDKYSRGDILSRFTVDLNNIINFISEYLVDYIGVIVWIVGLSISLILISWKLALITFGIFFIFLFVYIFIVIKTNPYYKKVQDSLSKITTTLNETLTNSQIINSFEINNIFINKFNHESYVLSKNNNKSYFWGTFVFIYMEFVTNFMIIIITYIGYIFINKNISIQTINMFGSDTSSTNNFITLTLFLLLMRQFISPFTLSSSYILATSTAISSLKRVNEIYDYPTEFKLIDKFVMNTLIEYNKNKIPAIKFDHVSFSYNKKDNAINNISFDIFNNEFIGIVGETGSGKSTIINLLTRLYNIDSGNIIYNNKSIYEYDLKTLRSNIFIIPQTVHLFDDTVYNNIKLSNTNISDIQIENLTKKIGCYEVFNNLPNGFNTIINNDNISNSQKQLLSLCRAIVSSAKIIVLDEINSSINSTYKKMLDNALKILKQDRTIIIIAHKLSIIKDASNIFVFKNGVLVESGTHNNLINKKGYYYDLYNI